MLVVTSSVVAGISSAFTVPKNPFLSFLSLDRDCRYVGRRYIKMLLYQQDAKSLDSPMRCRCVTFGRKLFRPS